MKHLVLLGAGHAHVHVLEGLATQRPGNVRITLPLNAIAPNLESDVERFIAELPEAVALVRAQLGASGL